MFTLRIEGPDGQREEIEVRPHRTLLVGRAPRAGARQQGTVDLCPVPWDPVLSRTHVELAWRPEGIEVRKLETAANPVFHRGQERDHFVLRPAERFVIGDSTFALEIEVSAAGSDERTPLQTIGFTLADLRKTRYRDADQRLEVLANLPHVIRGATSDEDLFQRLALLLLEAVPSADRAAVVRLVERPGDEEAALEVCHWDGRASHGRKDRDRDRDRGRSFRPSRRLVRDAILHRRQSVQCLWPGGEEGRPAGEPEKAGEASEYTLTEEDLDWAFCCPVPGEACAGWGLYLSGRLGVDPAARDLRPDLKFTEMVADVLGALKEVAQLKQRETALGRFFSPTALQVLSRGEADDALEPRQTRMTVLFCDLRGFSREAERARDDLLGLLDRVGHALDVMTASIHRHRGVVGDFQGDAALAFWGWPLDEPEAAALACRAALDIRRRFQEAGERSSDPLAGFRCGIGIASGEAVAGRLGSSGRFKIDVFGPVVNLASRLEGITKQLQVPILADEASVEEATRHGNPDWGRFRRLAHIRPYGMDRSLFVSEILPRDPAPDDGSPGDVSESSEVLGDDDLELYHEALEAFGQGRWEDALERLHRLPHWDQGKDFLLSFILRHQRRTPEGWDGVISLEKK